MKMLRINDAIEIDESALEESFIRASGPGGQNVNKVSSAVQLRFDLGACQLFDYATKSRARKLAGQRLTKDDAILIQASNHRTQKANREEARRRLADLLRIALIPPVPRKKTRPTKGSIERRLQFKKKRSLIKSNRGTSFGAAD